MSGKALIMNHEYNAAAEYLENELYKNQNISPDIRMDLANL
jgi:hypothetical protein